MNRWASSKIFLQVRSRSRKLNSSKHACQRMLIKSRPKATDSPLMLLVSRNFIFFFYTPPARSFCSLKGPFFHQLLDSSSLCFCQILPRKSWIKLPLQTVSWQGREVPFTVLVNARGKWIYEYQVSARCRCILMLCRIFLLPTLFYISPPRGLNSIRAYSCLFRPYYICCSNGGSLIGVKWW